MVVITVFLFCSSKSGFVGDLISVVVDHQEGYKIGCLIVVLDIFCLFSVTHQTYSFIVILVLTETPISFQSGIFGYEILRPQRSISRYKPLLGTRVLATLPKCRGETSTALKMCCQSEMGKPLGRSPEKSTQGTEPDNNCYRKR